MTAGGSTGNRYHQNSALGPIRIHVVDGLPDGEAILYAPPPQGTYPGHPDWVPLERRAVKIVGLDPGGR